MSERSPAHRPRRRTAGRLGLSPLEPAHSQELEQLDAAINSHTDTNAAPEQQPDNQEQILFTAEQAAPLLQVRPSWLRRRAAARLVPCRLVGKHLRFARQDIDEIASASRRPPKLDGK